ncbi:hypothetical protein GCM10027072_21930 [Streptomyces bullii]
MEALSLLSMFTTETLSPCFSGQSPGIFAAAGGRNPAGGAPRESHKSPRRLEPHELGGMSRMTSPHDVGGNRRLPAGAGMVCARVATTAVRALTSTDDLNGG